MAEAKLWSGHSLIHILMIGALTISVTSCRAEERPIGMTLLFQSAGMPVGVLRFDPDGFRGPVPGSVSSMSPKGGAQMSFMPGDSTRGIPKFVEVEWMVATSEYQKERKALNSRSDLYSEQWVRDSNQSNERAPHYIKRVDLTSIITPELIAQVRANAQGTQLKLIITFNNDQVDVQAQAYKWR